jgi:hypothetical protein
MRSLRRFFLLLPALWLVACSGTGGDSASAGAAMPAAGAAADPAMQGFRMKTGKDGDDDEAKLLEKYASQSPFMTDSKGKQLGEFKTASEFDKANTQFNRGYAGKEYQAGEFKKKSWWGSDDYAKKVYGGDTDANDLRKVSRHGSENAGENVKVSRDAGRTFDTGAYNTGAAREAGTTRLAKNSDAETDNRRDVGNAFSDPEIVPWQQQHGVTLEETKSKMGR